MLLFISRVSSWKSLQPCLLRPLQAVTGSLSPLIFTTLAVSYNVSQLGFLPPRLYRGYVFWRKTTGTVLCRGGASCQRDSLPPRRDAGLGPLSWQRGFPRPEATLAPRSTRSTSEGKSLRTACVPGVETLLQARRAEGRRRVRGLVPRRTRVGRPSAPHQRSPGRVPRVTGGRFCLKNFLTVVSVSQLLF